MMANIFFNIQEIRAFWMEKKVTGLLLSILVRAFIYYYYSKDPQL